MSLESFFPCFLVLVPPLSILFCYRLGLFVNQFYMLPKRLKLCFICFAGFIFFLFCHIKFSQRKQRRSDDLTQSRAVKLGHTHSLAILSSYHIHQLLCHTPSDQNTSIYSNRLGGSLLRVAPDLRAKETQKPWKPTRN